MLKLDAATNYGSLYTDKFTITCRDILLHIISLYRSLIETYYYFIQTYLNYSKDTDITLKSKSLTIFECA